MSSIVVIDYDAGNTMSVLNALKYLGYDAELTGSRDKIVKAERIIFPGVGAYADAMEKIRHYSLEDSIKEAVDNKVPFLGICLGLQLLLESSTENAEYSGLNEVPGLGVIKGKVSGFKENKDFGNLKVPHMGWNSLNIKKKDSKLFKGIPDGSFVYFVHSFYVKAEEPGDVAATSEYGIEFDASVEKENVFGCQFHPEKSGEIGMEILRNFCTV